MTEKIGVSALKKINVFYEGDIYDLACMLLKFHHAKDKDSTSRSYHTVNGLASAYAMITGVEQEKILSVFKRYRLPLGAIVDDNDK